MKILITGGTGFIGRALCRSLLDSQHQLVVWSRHPKVHPEIRMIASLDELANDAAFDAVINLAGEPIADKRWSAKQKQKIVSSRVGTTEQLLSYIERLTAKPKVLLNGSAIGYYGVGMSLDAVTEASGPDGSFSSQLCQAWETAALKAERLGIRTCLLRIGIVLGDGGALAKMLLPFKLGMGGRIGSGEQWMPWIHLADMVAIIETCLTDNTINGPVNCVAPEPVQNLMFTRTLGRVLKRPTFLPVPGLLLSLAMGNMAEELLLAGKKVVPTKLQEKDFKFQYPDLESALGEVLH